MQIEVKAVRVEGQLEGPDLVKFHLLFPSGEEMHVEKRVPRGDGEAFVRALGDIDYEVVRFVIVDDASQASGRRLETQSSTHRAGE